MKLADFKRLAQRTHTQAVIIGDGCRDYFVEVRHGHGAGVLTDRRGRPVKFRSLAQAKALARNAHEVMFKFRVAADEACSGHAHARADFSMLALPNKLT